MKLESGEEDGSVHGYYEGWRLEVLMAATSMDHDDRVELNDSMNALNILLCVQSRRSFPPTERSNTTCRPQEAATRMSIAQAYWCGFSFFEMEVRLHSNKQE